MSKQTSIKIRFAVFSALRFCLFFARKAMGSFERFAWRVLFPGESYPPFVWSPNNDPLRSSLR